MESPPCFHLSRFGSLWNPKIERIAIDALNDPATDVVRSAAEALGRHGSGKAEGALWTRLEKFHEQWRDRADELHYRLGARPDVLAEVGLEQVLVQAIAVDRLGWPTEDTIHRSKDLASPQMQPELESTLQEVEVVSMG